MREKTCVFIGHGECYGVSLERNLTFRIPEFVYFDEILYPEGFEKYHFKAAILARNQYMVDHAAYALCYVIHRWGGAAKTYEKAVKQGLTMINLGNEELWKNYGTMQ